MILNVFEVDSPPSRSQLYTRVRRGGNRPHKHQQTHSVSLSTYGRGLQPSKGYRTTVEAKNDSLASSGSQSTNLEIWTVEATTCCRRDRQLKLWKSQVIRSPLLPHRYTNRARDSNRSPPMLCKPIPAPPSTSEDVSPSGVWWVVDSL